MTKSEQINELAAALAKAKAAFKDIKRTAQNPFYKSVYAPLENIIAATDPALSAQGLSVTQLPEAEGLTTMLLHTSGQFISSLYPIRPVKDDPQGMGSAITYARRYALSAILGVASEVDDDGNDGSGKQPPGKAQPAPAPKPPAQPAPVKQPPVTTPPPADDDLDAALGTKPPEPVDLAAADKKAEISHQRSLVAMKLEKWMEECGVKGEQAEKMRHTWVETFYGVAGLKELSPHDISKLYRNLVMAETPKAQEYVAKVRNWIKLQAHLFGGQDA